MTIVLSRAQLAAILAVLLVVFSSGIVAGAVGSPLILGSQTNNAGTADTQLITNSSVIAFKLLQNGPGTGLMGHATAISGTTRGVYGRTDSPNGDGVQGRNAGPAGTGAAIRGFGGENAGAVLSSDADYPLQLTGPTNIPPMTVNSETRVDNLNADLLDGKDWSAFDLDGPHISYYTCAGAAMFPVSGPGTYGTEFGRHATVSGNTFVCPVLLPENATINQLRGRIHDTSATEEVSSCTLSYINLTAATTTVVATTPGSGVEWASGNRSVEDISFTNEANNANIAYWAGCTIAGTGSDVSIVAVQVGYTIEGIPYD